jgi:BirA family biotin operon repressor/biotin-[acetyl-CoA-carboxylase] ligase
LYDSLEHFGKSNAQISIKWPNDILLNGKKVAGILLETIAVSKNKIALSIGFGVNLISYPKTSDLEESAYSPTSVLAETDITVDPMKLLNKLAFNFANYEDTLRTRGFSQLRVLLLNRIHRLGESIVVKTTNEILNGQFLDINLDGHLILKTGGATRSIAAADVYFE